MQFKLGVRIPAFPPIPADLRRGKADIGTGETAPIPAVLPVLPGGGNPLRCKHGGKGDGKTIPADSRRA